MSDGVYGTVVITRDEYLKAPDLAGLIRAKVENAAQSALAMAERQWGREAREEAQTVK